MTTTTDLADALRAACDQIEEHNKMPRHVTPKGVIAAWRLLAANAHPTADEVGVRPPIGGIVIPPQDGPPLTAEVHVDPASGAAVGAMLGGAATVLESTRRERDEAVNRALDLEGRLDRTQVAAEHLLRIMDSINMPAMSFGAGRNLVLKIEALRALVIAQPKKTQ